MNSIKIAILPFQIVSEHERLQKLFVGFTEDLTTNFSKFIGLSVISYYSTQQIKDIANPNEIDKLAADYLVIATIRDLKDDIRISIQLIKTEDHSLVYAHQFDNPLDALLETQDYIVQQIVNVLQEKINYSLLSHSYRKKSVELVAYENYLQGMQNINKGTKDNDTKARSYFQSALEVEPYFSLAYSGLSLSYFNFWSCVLWDHWDENMKGAHKYALKAIEIDPNDYLALGILGRTYVYMHKYDEAEHNLRKSLRMNPNDVSNLLRVSYSMLFLGYKEEALELYLKAIDINPFHSNLYFAYGSNFHLECGDFKKSIELGKKAGGDCWTDFEAWMAAAYLQLKDYDNVWKNWNIYLEKFKAKAYLGKEALQEEAINWLSVINPFRGKNYLIPLADYIRAEGTHIQPKLERKPVKSKIKGNGFQFNGNVWEITFLGDVIVLKDMKGLHDIYKLLQQPNKEFHCLDLMDSKIDEFTSEASIDSKAKTSYTKKIKELQLKMEDAQEFNDLDTLEVLQEEYDAIVNHLSKSLGLAGKSRKLGSTVEKTRSAITWRIRSVIKKIKISNPELGVHFSNAIHTGVYCSYKPDEAINWNL